MITKNYLIKILLIIISIGLINGCRNSHLINDQDYLNSLEKKFNERRKLAINKDARLFSLVDSGSLSLQEEEAYMFLLAYMPLSDLADYDGDFHLANAQLALKSRTDYLWSKKMPEEMFLHYVLPVRVNNEDLDSFRILYYDELKARIGNITDPEQAALEINHWCHEKVTYQSADIRTSGPLNTILSARGRCGEESTFTVAALRSVGLAARQVYTPRWAHSDDNHAWVEVWIDGEWKYMGACEPEPVMDRGWFTEPARRAMLVHTRAFGKYLGPESVITDDENWAMINNLAKYANTREIVVDIVDSDGNAVVNAEVEFQLYNYAEFYPLAILKTGDDGRCSFITGQGDLLIWAHKGNKYAFSLAQKDEKNSFELVLSDESNNNEVLQFDIHSPEKPEPFTGVDELLSRKNSERLKQESMIRNNYIASWVLDESITRLCSDNRYPEDQIRKLLETSHGNYREITEFLVNVPSDMNNKALDLLGVMREKDLRDTKAEVLLDHLIYSGRFIDKELPDDIYKNYVLNPRIENELIRPWRSHIQGLQNEETIEAFRNDPTILIDWINNNFLLSEEENFYGVPISPVGLLNLRVTDRLSRKIFYVACCRSCGIPARLEPWTDIPQYYEKGEWNNVYFNGDSPLPGGKGILQLNPAGAVEDPQYFTHFTIARFEEGRYKTLKNVFGIRLSQLSDMVLPEGDYALVSGNRLDDNEVQVEIKYFSLEDGEKLELDLNVREKLENDAYTMKIDPAATVSVGSETISIGDINSDGLVLAWLKPDTEPSKHIINDIQARLSEFVDKGVDFLFIIIGDSESLKFREQIDKLEGLKIYYSFNAESNLSTSLLSQINLQPESYPFIIYIDSDNNIRFRSDGYTVGIGDQILKAIN